LLDESVTLISGLGVGLLLTPIMLDLNMAPESVAATSALMHLLSAMAALVNYAIAGDLLWQHCLVFFFCSTCGQICGQTVVDFLVRFPLNSDFLFHWHHSKSIFVSPFSGFACFQIHSSSGSQIRPPIDCRRHDGGYGDAGFDSAHHSRRSPHGPRCAPGSTSALEPDLLSLIE
jgi:hypothetical protein